ncbi:MAG TPA: isoleucine--tRNA ligase [Candidatus Thermoplasmatota archaeon]|jgi:isoleucyl-tRNA synthetase|nr:isoleucine--tRNA ligase [Candidatus Thermoplasmatota archaeon]
MAQVRRAAREYAPAQLEVAVQAQWAETRAHEKVRKARSNGKRFYFIDGPPYTSGHIHLGTAWNKVLKDSVLRWKRMKGFNVRDQAGYDMHGLPIEVKVEKELGIHNKQQIEAMGVDKFVAKCRAFSTEFLDVMTKEFQQLGIWLDWDHPYMTIRNSYIEGAWGSFAAAHRKGLVYQAQRSIAWCWRCSTALAAAELEYADREDPSLYVKFPLHGKPNEFLVIWTTTPWTLPGNVAIAAHPELGYARVQARRGGRDEFLWVVDTQVEHLVQLGRYDEHFVLETRSGRELEGWRYDHVFAEEVPHHRDPGEKRNRVILGTHVTADKTGLVHTATGFGAEDFEIGQQVGIAAFCPVDEAGVYTAEAGVFAGQFVKDAEYEITELLRGRGALLQAGTETHSYAHCWRCKNPIIYRATEQWFLEVTKVKDRMLQEVERVTWTPAWAGSARQRDWVEGARDWCVSRQRYWGIPIPIWQCGQGHVAVVGSAAQLRAEARNYKDVLARYKAQLHVPELEQRLQSKPTKEIDLHRPWIDEVVLSCKQCKGDMRRVPDVFDVWYDSACASWAQLGWPANQKDFKQWWPCDWIVEGLDQTRGWFYSQLAAGVTAFGKVPYDSVLMHGFVHDEQGRPMSKSLGNIIPPEQVIQKHGADAFRLYILSTCPPWEDVHFNWQGVQNAQRALNILWNVHVFATHAMDGQDPARIPAAKAAKGLRAEDRWLQSRVATLAKEVDEAFAAGELHKAARLLQGFVLDDLSRWYVRLVRDRVNLDGAPPAKLAALRTLHGALLDTARLLAPICPHITEAMYRDLGGKLPTLHLEPWPKTAGRKPKLELQMAAARAIVDAAMAARDKAQLKLRLPVAQLTVAGTPEAAAAVKALHGLVGDMTNAKRVVFAGAQWEGLALTAQPDRTKIGPTFKGHAPKVMDALRAARPEVLREALGAGSYQIEVEGATFEIAPEMVKFQTALPPGVVGAEFAGGSVYLDTEITPELQAEGLAREVVRRIQETRKEAGFERAQKVRTELGLMPESARLLQPWMDRIAAQTRSASLKVVDKPSGKHVKEWDVEGERVVVGLA